MSKHSLARQRATLRAIELVGDLLPLSNNKTLSKERLDRLTDEEFHQLMEAFRDGKDFLQIISPIMDDKSRLDYDNLHKVANKFGINLYQRVWLTDNDGSSELSNKNCMILYLPMKIQQQLNSKKITIPKSNNSIDHFTGQVTGKESKGARISYPEVNALLAMGLVNTVKEYMHFRGGSENGVRLIEQSIMQTGDASAEVLKPYTGTVGSTMMLHSYLTAMMLKSTLLTK